MKYTFVFPGQGSQFVGMGKELADNFQSARDVFQEVNDAVSQDLFKLMVEGPEHELTLTANAQPALMANSMAVVRVLEKDFGIKLKTKPALSPDILWVNIRLLALPASSLCAIPQNCCGPAVKLCNRPSRSGSAAWLL